MSLNEITFNLDTPDEPDIPIMYEEDPVITMVHAEWVDSIAEAKEWLENVKLDHSYGGVSTSYWTHEQHIADAQKLVDDLTATFGETYGVQS